MKRPSKNKGGSSKHAASQLQKKMYKAPDAAVTAPASDDVGGKEPQTQQQITTEMTSSGILNVYNLRSWWNAILAEPHESYEARASLYQRALTYLPGSYKLWFNFLKESRLYVKQFDLLSQQEYYEVVNELHERALVYMHAMPQIWLSYCKFLAKQKHITRTRQTYDRALQSLPATQHGVIWSRYLEWAESFAEDYPQTAKQCYQRFLKLKPECTLDYIDFLLRYDFVEEALEVYVKLLAHGDTMVAQKQKKTRFQLWMELCEFIAKYPSRSQDLTIKPDELLRHAIGLYTEQSGKLWVFLGDYYTRMGLFSQAREIFEEALAQLASVRDFGVIFNAFVKFEEAMLEVSDDEGSDDDDEDEANDSESSEESLADQVDALLDWTFRDEEDDDQDIQEKDQVAGKFKKFSKEEKDELKFVRLENLIQRRPFLLSNVVLRQNPHNVYEWLSRVKLCEQNTYLTIKTFTEAIQTVDPQKSTGKTSKIWVRFADFYEQYDELQNANLIYHKASQLQFKSIEEVAFIFCSWAEMHIRANNIDSALKIMKYACNKPKSKLKGKDEKSGSLVYNIRAWSLYLDLLENCGTFEETKTAYERVLDLKIATPETVLNFTRFLQTNNFFEESFRVYERAVQLFKWPHVYDIWMNYLSKVIQRLAGSKVERVRHLFNQVLKDCPRDKSRLFLFMFADYEENFGLLSHAMAIYDRATKEVDQGEELMQVFNMYIAKATQFYGVSRTREVYERALERITPGQLLVTIGLRFAKLERKLNEVERARGIYTHLSQFCNPNQYEATFWHIWEQFEVQFGNSDSYDDYLRVKRTVSLRYAVVDPIMQEKVIESEVGKADQEMVTQVNVPQAAAIESK